MSKGRCRDGCANHGHGQKQSSKVSHGCIFKELGDTANPYSQKINPGVLILDPQNL